MTGIALEDTQCGLKGFHASVARLLFHSKGIERFAFDVEIWHSLASWTHHREVPSTGQCCRSRVRPLADPISMLATWSVSDSDACQPTDPLLAPAGRTSVET